MPISRLGINKLISLFFFFLFFFSFSNSCPEKIVLLSRSENTEKIVELGLTLFTEEHDQISHRSHVLLSCGFAGSSCEDHMCFCGSWIPTMPVSFSRFGPYSC
jgi:hypothetical protein